jgi:hypothetical protein
MGYLQVHLLMLCLAGIPGFCSAAEPPDKALLKEVGPGLFEIGKVSLNTSARTLTLPATVNMTEGNVEYFLVTGGGKTHESVFRTDAEPYHIHLGMLLLGAKGKGTNEFPQDKSKIPPGDPVSIEVSWKPGDKGSRLRAEELVLDRAAGKEMQKLDWIYNGSEINAEGFAAQQNGSIVSLIDDPEALINNPLPRRNDDDNWLVNGKELKKDAPVEVIITLPNARKPPDGNPSRK